MELRHVHHNSAVESHQAAKKARAWIFMPHKQTNKQTHICIHTHTFARELAQAHAQAQAQARILARARAHTQKDSETCKAWCCQEKNKSLYVCEVFVWSLRLQSQIYACMSTCESGYNESLHMRIFVHSDTKIPWSSHAVIARHVAQNTRWHPRESQ